MTNNTYILTSKESDVSVTFKYNLKGLLILWELEEHATDEDYAIFSNKIPKEEVHMEDYIRKYKNKLRVQILPPDLSFKKFWDKYAHKVGDKPRAERLWDNLSKANKVKALRYIQIYKQTCLNSGTSMAHASRYLNAQYFNN